jgi:hypothetical protein
MLEETKDSKYLGVTISNDLSWANHISNITANPNRTIGFLRRNILLLVLGLESCSKQIVQLFVVNSLVGISGFC